jgi:hypothetical protein
MIRSVERPSVLPHLAADQSIYSTLKSDRQRDNLGRGQELIGLSYSSPYQVLNTSPSCPCACDWSLTSPKKELSHGLEVVERSRADTDGPGRLGLDAGCREISLRFPYAPGQHAFAGSVRPDRNAAQSNAPDRQTRGVAQLREKNAATTSRLWWWWNCRSWWRRHPPSARQTSTA